MQARRSKAAANTTDESVEVYCAAHPRSPAAVRRPRLVKRGHMWVALLGADLQTGIAGFGSSAEMALRAFDARYLSMLRPPMAA